MECCKSENTFIFAWTPERIEWAKFRREIHNLGWPDKPRRSADLEIDHAARHGVPLYRVTYGGWRSYEVMSPAEYATCFGGAGMSLPHARQLLVLLAIINDREDEEARRMMKDGAKVGTVWRKVTQQEPVNKAADWRDLFERQRAEMGKQKALFYEQRAEMDKGNAEIAKGNAEIDRLARENRKFRVVLAELGLDPEQIPDLPGAE